MESRCSWGYKRNSQGNPSYWKGCKLHLDVTDNGISVSAIITWANVHDSQVAIPLERMTEQRVNHLYSLMDSAYDAKPIRDFITDNGKIPIIDLLLNGSMLRIYPSTVFSYYGRFSLWLFEPKFLYTNFDLIMPVASIHFFQILFSMEIWSNV